MPKQYEMPKDAIHFDPDDDLTEQEHKDSCDINIMIGNITRGIAVRGAKGEPIYGFDDTNNTGLQHRIDKQKLESELQETADSHEFSESELAMMPPKVAEKFRFKKTGQKPDAKNDDKTTKEAPVKDQEKELKKATDPKTTIE